MKKILLTLSSVLLVSGMIAMTGCDGGGSDSTPTDETESVIGQSGTGIGPLDIDGDGVSDGTAIDTDDDGTPDGVDTDGDGKIDQEYSDEYELLLTDSEAVTADAAALGAEDITFSGSDSASSVTGSFTLPTSGSSGTTISWSENSDTGNAVNLSGTGNSLGSVDNSGWVESDGFFKIVELTATVSKGGESTTKDIIIYVSPPATTKIAAGGDGITFKMVLVPGGLSFKTQINDRTTDPASLNSVSDAYWIADTEVTYELWSAVYTWATDVARGANRYSFANAGRQGGNLADVRAPVGTNQHPVTNINWRDTLVWCNALTEWYNAENGTSYACVYTSDDGYNDPIRTSTDSSTRTASTDGSQDKPYINPDATGFRLPTVAEWSCAARYKGSNNANGSYEYPADSGNYWTPGDYASGADADYNDATETGNVAWYYSNSGSSTHVVGTAGNSESAPAVRSGNANALGLFDMSGNVYEWNFEWHPSNIGSYRMVRGGGWYNFAKDWQVGFWSCHEPYNTSYSIIGFRFTRTQ